MMRIERLAWLSSDIALVLGVIDGEVDARSFGWLRPDSEPELMTAGRGGSNRDHKDDALDAYIWVDDVDGLFAELQQRQAEIVSPPQLRIYGMKELEVRDLDGYVLCFGEEIKESG